MRENSPVFPHIFLAEGPPRTQNRPTQIRIHSSRVAELGQQQVDPRGQVNRRHKLDLLVPDAGTEAATPDLEHELSDRAAIQVAAFYLRRMDALDQVLEQRGRIALLAADRRVAEDARAFKGQRRRRTDRASQSV